MVPIILLPLALVNFKSSTFVHKVLQTSCDIVITFAIVCCCLFFVEFLDLLHGKPYEITFSTSGHWSQTDSGWRSYGHFTPALRSVPRHFRTRSVVRFYHNSSHRSPKFTILDALERRLDGALQYTIFSHGTSLIMDENLITTAALWRWWWSNRTIFFAGMLHTYCLSKQIYPKTLVFKTNWHGGIPCLSTFFYWEWGLDSGCWATNKS